MPSSTSTRPESRSALQGVPYEQTTPGKPPVPITVAPPPPSSARLGIHPLLRPSTSPEDSPESSYIDSTARSKLRDDIRRDSGLAPSYSTEQESRTTIATDTESSSSIKKSQSLPRIASSSASTQPPSNKLRKWSTKSVQQAEMSSEPPKLPETTFGSLSLDVPAISFEDLASPNKIEFSKRGSMLISGKKANNSNGNVYNSSQSRVNTKPRRQSPALPSSASATTSIRIISADDEMLSQKVRSMYESGTDQDAVASVHRFSAISVEGIEEEVLIDDNASETPSQTRGTHLLVGSYKSGQRASSRNSKRDSFIVREEHELAGGIEDWDNVRGEDVDRYGFIIPRSSQPINSSTSSLPIMPSKHGIFRSTTLLQLAAETPRRQRSKLSRVSNSTRKAPAGSSLGREARPSTSQSSHRSLTATNRTVSRIRSATNRLPHNRERRFMDEAGDMLTLPPGLADVAHNEITAKAVHEMKRKEWLREDKWRKMAKSVKSSQVGGGMIFEFDTKSPKLIERTWKGIPDRWRATAWHAFLTASAKKHSGYLTDEELINSFQDLVDESSPDDVQIDIDVPRTINSHIMFRRRYRGGQRLLFRVLHCVSIHFPDTGYVQGMAALAATLLCYFDEEMAFVMLVRMWELRGLAMLYQAGFEGLMQALDEFEKKWLDGGEIAVKLNELGILLDCYLTIFNYSIPFPAQLRVWDVFMLLGDAEPPLSASPETSTPLFYGGLDVLHAASAALIDGTREILLDSDFENGMKVLTSWIPIRDEDLLMRVARAEWNLHRRKK